MTMIDRRMQRSECPDALRWLGIPVLSLLFFFAPINLAMSQTRIEIAVPPSLASVELPTATQNDRVLLQRAIQLAEQQPSEALQTVLRIMESDHRKVIYVPSPRASAGFHRYVSLRMLCQQVISVLGESELQAYRNQVDPLAVELIEEATESKSPGLLRRLLREWPQSSYAGRAALLLGDLAFADGDFDLAREAWLSLIPEVNNKGIPHYLVHQDLPDQTAVSQEDTVGKSTTTIRPLLQYSHLTVDRGSIGISEVIKRLVLCEVYSGRLEVARRHLLRFRDQLDLPGDVYGEQGNLLDLLISRVTKREELRETDHIRMQFDFRLTPAWTLNDVPWKRTASTGVVIEPVSARVRTDELILFNDLRGIYASDIRTGKGIWSPNYLIAQVPTVAEEFEDSEPYSGIMHPTVSIDDGVLVARQGSPVASYRRGRDAATAPGSVIIALDLESEGLLLPGFPVRPPSSQWCFDGNPLLVDGDILTVLRKNGTVRSDIFVACYDIDNGQHKWITQIGSVNARRSGRHNEINQPWLRPSADGVLICTNLGIVSRVSRTTGDIDWITTYPHDSQREHSVRRLTTGQLESELAVIAPGDSDVVFCLECLTGRILWMRDNEIVDETTQVTGISNDEVILCGKQLKTIDLYRGVTKTRFPLQFNQLATIEQFPTGKGVARWFDGELIWPTNAGLFVFDRSGESGGWLIRRVIDTGQPVSSVVNLILTRGQVVIQSDNTLTGYERLP